jgi:hypothetical protein
MGFRLIEANVCEMRGPREDAIENETFAGGAISTREIVSNHSKERGEARTGLLALSVLL